MKFKETFTDKSHQEDDLTKHFREMLDSYIPGEYAERYINKFKYIFLEEQSLTDESFSISQKNTAHYQ